MKNLGETPQHFGLASPYQNLLKRANVRNRPSPNLGYDMRNLSGISRKVKMGENIDPRLIGLGSFGFKDEGENGPREGERY